MKVFVFLALFIAFFGLVLADHATPDDDDEIPSGTFGPPIESPHPVRYYVGKPPQTFRAPFLTVETVVEASVSYTTQTISIFNGFFGTSEFSSDATTTSVSAAFVLVFAVIALVF
mmetsp:Transcript_15817/g.24734  ORF Transcript_15817/g.24734 Transcript_15817/m.24734 type:complete len:115 (+) Transcript_15817:41-385(+)